MSNFSQIPLVFAAISEFWFSGFSRHTIHELIQKLTAVTAFLIAFLIKINNKKLDQIISKLLTQKISIEIIKEAKNLRFPLEKKTYEKTKRHCFNGEQQKDIEMKAIILVKADEM